MKIKFILTSVIAALATACTTTQLNEAESLASTVAPLVADYAASGHASYAQALPVLFNSLADFDPSGAVNINTLGAAIETGVSDFTNSTSGSTGQKLAAAVLAALPPNPTGAQANTALQNAAAGASTGANLPAVALLKLRGSYRVAYFSGRPH